MEGRRGDGAGINVLNEGLPRRGRRGEGRSRVLADGDEEQRGAARDSEDSLNPEPETLNPKP